MFNQIKGMYVCVLLVTLFTVGFYCQENSEAKIPICDMQKINIEVMEAWRWVEKCRREAWDRETDDLFGYSVDIGIRQQKAIIGAPYDNRSGGPDSGSAYIYQRGSNTYEYFHEAKLAYSGSSGDMFGKAVAMSDTNNIAVVGAPMYDLSGRPDAGVIFLYTKSGTSWGTPILTYYPASVLTGDQFGSSVDIDYTGRLIMAGAPYTDYIGGDSGLAYVLYGTKTSSGWSLQSSAALIPSQPQTLTAGDLYGYAVKLNPYSINYYHYAIVGAPNDDEQTITDSGAAYIFKYDYTNSTWTQVIRLIASDADDDDHFGASVSISCPYAVVGAPDEDSAALNGGAVYVFYFDGTNWLEIGKLTSPNPVRGDHFGYSVDINNQYIVVGTKRLPSQTGAAYVFKKTALKPGSMKPSWGYCDTLLGSDADWNDDHFGFSCSLSGISNDVALVGAPKYENNDYNPVYPDEGAAYFYHYEPTNTITPILDSNLGQILGMTIMDVTVKSSGQTAQSAQAKMHNSATSLIKGEMCEVTWAFDPNEVGPYVKLEYSLDGEDWSPVPGANMLSAESGSFMMEYAFGGCVHGLLKITDVEDPNKYDLSPYFSAYDPCDGLALLSPRGGGVLQGGEDLEITWLGDTSSGLVNLEYLTDLETEWITIEQTDNDGLFEWTIPDIDSEYCLLRIVDPNIPERFAMCPDFFEIQASGTSEDVCLNPAAADMNSDCLVNLLDFIMVAEDWLYCGDPTGQLCIP
ncbi:MAG: hypothetical protein JW860_13455 [Sedimentisphaerales bacterium]|nr:hypothetical protein [Sedimentisphaerales bacterium]